MKELAESLVWITIAAVLLYALLRPMPYDDSDPPGEKERSGLRIYTDHRTGCQYVGAGFLGGIIPRRNPDGSQVCIKQQEPDAASKRVPR